MARPTETLGVAFVSLAEGIDATTPAGKLQMHILGAISEFERARCAERVRAGLARVKRQGRTARAATGGGVRGRARRSSRAGIVPRAAPLSRPGHPPNPSLGRPLGPVFWARHRWAVALETSLCYCKKRNSFFDHLNRLIWRPKTSGIRGESRLLQIRVLGHRRIRTACRTAPGAHARWSRRHRPRRA